MIGKGEDKKIQSGEVEFVSKSTVETLPFISIDNGIACNSFFCRVWTIKFWNLLVNSWQVIPDNSKKPIRSVDTMWMDFWYFSTRWKFLWSLTTLLCVVPITSESKGAMIVHDCFQTKSSAMDRALEVQAKLAPEFPSFVKLMLPSHVTGGFWLVNPKPYHIFLNFRTS